VHLQVAQELVLASRDPIILCGDRRITWSSFARAIRSIRNRILNDQLANPEHTTLDYLRLYHKSEKLTVRETATINWYDSEGPRAVASAALRVDNLAEIREAGLEAGFVEQFERTIFMQATDPRDHIFAILGMSQFIRGTLKADYTKSKEQVATEATAFFMRNDLAMYMRTRLWEYKHDVVGLTESPFVDARQATTPSWAPDLEVLGRRALSEHFVPPSYEIQHVLRASAGVAPIMHFSDDFKVLYTAVYDLGSVIENYIDVRGGRFGTDKGYWGRHPLRKALPDSTVLVGLFGINAPFLLQIVKVEPATCRILTYVEMDREGHYDSMNTQIHRWGHTFDMFTKVVGGLPTILEPAFNGEISKDLPIIAIV
jgi:hypothetical protein